MEEVPTSEESPEVSCLKTSVLEKSVTKGRLRGYCHRKNLKPSQTILTLPACPIPLVALQGRYIHEMAHQKTARICLSSGD